MSNDKKIFEQIQVLRDLCEQEIKNGDKSATNRLIVLFIADLTRVLVEINYGNSSPADELYMFLFNFYKKMEELDKKNNNCENINNQEKGE